MKELDDLMELADCYAIKVYNLASSQYHDQEGKDEARAALLKEMKALVQEAQNYRYLRSKHWNKGGLCVVDNKDDRCIYLGTYCPSGNLLDEAIAEEKGAKPQLREALEVQPAREPLPPRWAEFLHYPGCWDTAAYPTLESAVHEALAWTGCAECKPPRKRGT